MKQKKTLDEKAEIRQDVRQIITEAYNQEQAPDLSSRFDIQRYVSALMTESKEPKLTSYLMRAQESLDRGAKSFMIFEQFGKGLEQFTYNEAVKNTVKQMNETLYLNTPLLECLKLTEMISSDIVREDVFENVNKFFNRPDEITKADLIESLDNLYNLNEDNTAIKFRTIIENVEQAEPEMFETNAINESKEYLKKKNALQEQKMQDIIQKRVEKYLNERLAEDDERAQKISETYTLANLSNKMGLRKIVEGLMKSDAGKNERLNETLTAYATAMNTGCYEERLYEAFVRAITPFDYLLPVEKAINKIQEKANENPEAIMLTRILQEMSESSDSYFYIDSIMEDVCRYCLAQTPENRIQAINACMPYAANRYVNEIIRVINESTAVRNNNTLSEQAMSIKDRISMIRENVSVENLYSPVLYIRENQSVFSVDNNFYLKNGNIICPLGKEQVSQLDENFVRLTHLVNDPNVQILEDSILLSSDERWATIYEDRVVISEGGNEYTEDRESLRRLDEMAMKYDAYDSTDFFIMASALLENFNRIAHINFAKRLVMNNNPEISCEMYRLEENIFLATHNGLLGQNTFFRNVNPVFCKNKINEHFGINVSTLFEDMLPNQDKLILALNETKNEYEKSIEDYEQAIADLEAAKEESTSNDIERELDDAIADAKQKLDDVKAEYKEWQKETDATMKDTDDDADTETDTDTEDTDDNAEDDNTTREESNKPLDPDEVDDYKDSLSVPLSDGGDATAPAEPADAQAEGDDEVPAVTDDEFDEYMANSDDEDVYADDDAEDVVADEEPVDEVPAEENPEDDEVFPEVEYGDGENEFTDDDIYTDDEYDDENSIGDETPAEDVPSDEDIITGGDEDVYASNDAEAEYHEPGEMKTVDAETGAEYTEPAATNLFGGDTENPLKGVPGADEETDLFNPASGSSEFNIVNVMFDENVKEGTISKSGQVLVLRPMIDKDGNKYPEQMTVKFYLDGENKPVVQTDQSVSTAMYNEIVNSIKEHPQFSNVANNGLEVNPVVGADAGITDETPIPETPEEAAAADDNWLDDYLANGNDTDRAGADVVPAAVTPAGIDAAETPVVDEPSAEEVVTDEPVVADVPAETADDATDDIFQDFDLDDDEVVADEPVASETPAEDVLPAEDPVDTYTEPDGTEIEVPAPAADETPVDEPAVTAEEPVTEPASAETPAKATSIDDIIDDTASDEEDAEEDESIIPESKQPKKDAKQVNEARKTILSVKSKPGKRPF